MIQTFLDYSYIEKFAPDGVTLLPKNKAEWDNIKFVSKPLIFKVILSYVIIKKCNSFTVAYVSNDGLSQL